MSSPTATDTIELPRQTFDESAKDYAPAKSITFDDSRTVVTIDLSTPSQSPPLSTSVESTHDEKDSLISHTRRPVKGKGTLIVDGRWPGGMKRHMQAMLEFWHGRRDKACAPQGDVEAPVASTSAAKDAMESQTEPNVPDDEEVQHLLAADDVSEDESGSDTDSECSGNTKCHRHRCRCRGGAPQESICHAFITFLLRIAALVVMFLLFKELAGRCRPPAGVVNNLPLHV